MTVSSNYAPTQYVGDASTTAFPFPFPFFEGADLQITIFNPTASAFIAPPPALNGSGTYDFTVTPNTTVQSDGTGKIEAATVTFNTAPASGYLITIYRDVPAVQDTILTDYGPFPAKSVEAALDRLTIIDQQLSNTVGRAILIPQGDPDNVNLTLPPASLRAGKALLFDSLGNVIAGQPLQAGVTVSAPLIPFLSASTLGGAAAIIHVPQIVTVTQYGADNTGTTDCTANVLAAWAAVGPAGRCYWPAGRYKITPGLLTSNAAILNIGDGKVATWITSDIPAGTYFNMTGQGAWFEKMAFTSNVTRTSGVYLNFPPGTSQCGVVDFYMENYYSCINLSSDFGGYAEVGDIRNASTGATGSCCIQINGGNAQYLRSITIDNASTLQPTAGIVITNSGCVNITDCDVIHCGNDLYITPGAGQAVASVFAENSFFDTSSAAGISIIPSGGGEVIRLRFANCWASSHNINGVYVDATGGTVAGLEFDNLHCILNSSNNVSINGTTAVDCRFQGGVYAGCALGSGIAIGVGVTNFAIQGARIGAGYGCPGNKDGIFIGTGPSDHYMITDNFITGNTSAAIVNGGTGANTIIANNLTT